MKRHPIPPIALPDPVSACCVGEVCTEMTEADCSAVGGYWVVDVSCPPANPVNPCETGVCCVDPDWWHCEDGPEYDTLDECESAGGSYVGGATCYYEYEVCPVCTFEEPANCKEEDPTQGFIIQSNINE